MAKRHITVVVSDEQAEMLAQLAFEQGESLSAYVRGRLMAKENLEAEFRALQSTLVATIHETIAKTPETAPMTGQGTTGTPPAGGALDGKAMGLLVEILLHLRALSNPQKIQAIRAEVGRLGYEQFN